MFESFNHKSYFSLCRALLSPKQLIQRAVKDNHKFCGLMDIGSLSGVVEFIKEAKKHDIKTVVGCEILIKEIGTVLLIVKNNEGWRNLLKCFAIANSPENIEYDKKIDRYYPVIDLESLQEYNDYLICVDYENTPNRQLESIFSADYYTTMDVMASPTYYWGKDQLEDYKVLLSTGFKTSLDKLQEKIKQSKESYLLAIIKNGQQIPQYTDLQRENTEQILNEVEDLDVLRNPELPHFPCPSLWTDNYKNTFSEIDYLRRLCQEGFESLVTHNENVYRQRLEDELKVIEQANLAGYFLVVWDFVKWAKEEGYLIGCGRGSSGGSLIAYLLNITTVDPIQYGLLFERFYNEGRNTKSHISLPDIDVDVPTFAREPIISYLKKKYGYGKVAQMSTFGRLMGAGALKEVLRTHKACDFNQMNRITKTIPSEDKISDKLEQDDETSILRWTLKNHPERLSSYCKYEDNKLVGEYAKYFEQAIRLEGTLKSQSKHAAAVVVSPHNLNDVVPMIYDKHNDGEPIIGFDMSSAESVSCCKLDILGLAILDILMEVNEL